jgi:hypothetical protein
MRTSRAFVTFGIFALACTVGRSAHAHGDTDKPEGNKAEADGHVEIGGAEASESSEGEGKETTKKYEIGFDAVFGFGKVPAVNQTAPATFGTVPTQTLDNTTVSSDSYILGFGYWISPKLRVGARIPLVHGVLSPDGLKTSRGATTFGNIELAVGTEIELSTKLKLLPTLGLALPTSAGLETPEAEEINKEPTAPRNREALDRFSILRAAGASRGNEENAMFAARRFGIVPELALEYRSKKLELEPFVKMDNLLSASSTLKKTYLGEVTVGLRATYELQEWLDVGARVWLNVAFDKEDRDSSVLAILEPQVRFHFGPVTPLVGLLIPVAPFKSTDTNTGPVPTNPVFDARFIALRLAVGARF